eukprot:CAMPEP_0195655412 /NCGR_PEP_ID=MMETSP0815-20121206/34446_1 /TAXON_ID=97485 /ORGANISM="Prymnesium parvum, Strain Texoma1" /LENGTH=42 /DNA_ID= /DNA_START= /DNA_END= /DNA_ORIENTATION=
MTQQQSLVPPLMITFDPITPHGDGEACWRAFHAVAPSVPPSA